MPISSLVWSARGKLLLGSAALVCAAAGVVLWHHGAGAAPALKPPPMTSAGNAKLQRIDRDLGFQLARLASSPDDGGIVAQVAEAWLQRGKLTADGADFDSALKLLGKAEQVVGSSDPRLPSAHAHVLWARHRFAEARQVAAAALERFPGNERLQELVADSAIYAGDLQGGEDQYRKARDLDPRASTPWIGLAYKAEITGQLEEAMDLLEKAMNAAYPRPLGYERQAYIHAVMGEVRAKQGDLAEARRQYEWALAKMPNYAAARTGLADVAMWQGHGDEAEKLLRGLIASEYPNAPFEIKLADLRESDGDKAEASQLRQHAETFYEWSVSTGYDGYLRPLAALKLAAGDYRRAAELAARDLEIRPTSESRAILENIIAQAKAAGEPVDETAVRRVAAQPLTVAKS